MTKTSKRCLIKKINHGIACRIGNTIYYNKALERYPELFKAILSHEKKHTEGFTLGDIMMDLKNEEIAPFKKQYYKFILQNPSALTELLPCGIYDKKFVWNPLLTVMWLMIILGTCLIIGLY